jgi:hypothetical protein
VIGYFPALYPDELLYSAIARFGVHTGQRSKAVHRALFGQNVTHPSLAFPTNLDELGRRTGLDPDRLIKDHTNLPYFTAYMEQSRANTIFAAMKVKPIGLTAVHNWVISGNSLLPTINALRFCDRCARQDEINFGEPYWHRVHQLNLVMVCPEHGCVLKTTQPLSSASKERLHPASAHTISRIATEAIISHVETSDFGHLIRMARDCAALTRGEMLNGVSRDHFAKQLWSGLQAKSFGRGTSIDRAGISAAASDAWIARYWPTMFPITGSSKSWFSRVALGEGPSRTEAVQLAFEILKMLPTHYQAFGPGPWICVNRLAEHFGLPVVTNIKRRLQGGKTIGHFSCDCGSVYTRHRDESGTETRPRHTRFGPLLQGFMQTAETQKWSLDRAAKKLGVGRQTLKRALKIEGVTVNLQQRRRRADA